MESFGYTIGEKLGEGTTADVFLAKDPEGYPVVVKIFRTFSSAITRELYILKYIRDKLNQGELPIKISPTFIGSDKISNKIIVITDYFPSKELYKIKERFSNAERVRCAFNVIYAVYLLHKIGIVHRDIKCENIICDPIDQSIRLIDFDTSCTVESIAKYNDEYDFTKCMPGIVGTHGFICPELYGGSNLMEGNPERGFKMLEKCDVFSLGTTIHEILTDGELFDIDEIRLNYKNEMDENRTRRNISKKLGRFNPMWKELIISCTEENPRNRPTSEQVYNIASSLYLSRESNVDEISDSESADDSSDYNYEPELYMSDEQDSDSD